MRIDYPTLLLAASWITAAFAVLGLFLARAEPALQALRPSSLGNLCFAVGMPLLILRGGPYAAAGVILGNGFIFADGPCRSSPSAAWPGSTSGRGWCPWRASSGSAPVACRPSWPTPRRG